jgi:hypothetical protein
LGVQAFDFNQNQSDRNGFYSLKMFVDKIAIFSMLCDSFSFAESRYVNASIDYESNYTSGNRILKSRKLEGNLLSFFKTDVSNGMMVFTDNKLHELVVQVGDAAGNTVNLRFWVKPQKPAGFVQVPVISDSDSTIWFGYNKINKFETKDLKVEFPIGSLYEDMVFRYRKSSGGNGFFSDVHYLHSAETPLHSRIKVSIKPTKLPTRLQSKALIVRVDKNGKRSPSGGSFEKGFVSTTTNTYTGYAIAVDTIAPTIRPGSENKKSKSSLKFTVSDNLSGIKTYKGTINGKWVLVEWDPKNKLMVYKFDKMVETGENIFVLYLEDEKGNGATYSTTFTK